MPITKAKKVSIVKELKDKVTAASSVVFVNFHGLAVSETTKLRKLLRAQGIGLRVAKKTLLRLAFSDLPAGKAGAPIEGAMPALDGEVAVAFQAGGIDQLAVPREVYQFAKTHPEQLKILGGVFEGKYADAGLMLQLATIPSREALLGQLLNLFNAPIRAFVIALDQITKLTAKNG